LAEPRDTSANASRTTAPLRRLHWGCGGVIAPGWINSDVIDAPGIDVICDIRTGLRLPDDHVDYIVSHHSLPELKIWDQIPALQELRRVLKPGGVLRLSLPDLDAAIAAYLGGRQSYFEVYAWDTLAGNFITQILWHSYSATLFTTSFAEELLTKAGFAEVRQTAYRVTSSRYPEIVELDSRPAESFYVEAFK
jgi:SAM-dependent methyltransferase